MTIKRGSEALTEILLAEKVEYVFGLPGSTEMHFLDSLEDCPEIRYILGLHETVAMGMAEGYARASGKIGFVNLHTNTGLGSAIPLLVNAHAGGVPLVVTAGQQSTRLLIQEPPLGEYDLKKMVDQFTRWSTEVLNLDDLALVMRRAFKVAKTPPTGPVFVSLPQDIMEQEIDFQYIPGSPPYVRLRPEEEAVRMGVSLIQRARLPVIMVGSGVSRDGAVSEVVKLAEFTGAPVYQPHVADVDFPTSHAQYLGEFHKQGPYSNHILKNADLLIIVGTPQTEIPKPLFKSNAKIIQLDANPWEIAKNRPVSVGIQGNIQISLAEMNRVLQTTISSEFRDATAGRLKSISEEKTRIRNAFLTHAEEVRDNNPISASRLMQELRKALLPGTCIVDDSWSSSYALRQCIDFTEPGSYHRFRGGGSIGWGMSGALGVKLASPDRPVVAVTGDGSAMWCNQSLWTAARYNIPVMYVVCANSCYQYLKASKIRHMGKKARGRFLGLEFDKPRIAFCQLAEAMGVMGRRVEKPEDLEEAFRLARDLEKPTLVEVMIE